MRQDKLKEELLSSASGNTEKSHDVNCDEPMAKQELEE